MSKRNANKARTLIAATNVFAMVAYDENNECYYVNFYGVERVYYRFWQFRDAVRNLRGI